MPLVAASANLLKPFQPNDCSLYPLKTSKNSEVSLHFQWVTEIKYWSKIPSQPVYTCSKLTIERLEEGVKYVQS